MFGPWPMLTQYRAIARPSQGVLRTRARDVVDAATHDVAAVLDAAWALAAATSTVPSSAMTRTKLHHGGVALAIGLIDGLPDGGVVDDRKAGGGGAGPGRNGREHLADGRDASVEVGLEDGHAPPGEDDLDVAGHDTTVMTAPRPRVIRRRSGAYGLERAGAVAARAAAAALASTAMIFFIH